MKVLIVYYSTYGNVYKMAKLVADGVHQVKGTEAVIRRVPELMPETLVYSSPAMKAGVEMQNGIPLVTLNDFNKAGAIAFGTPTRFGNVSSQLKNQIDQLGSLWMKRVFEGKPAGIFVSSATLHGGQESTILSLTNVLFHLGFVIIGVPYSVTDLYTTRSGGSPYGPGHVSSDNNTRDIDENEANICRAFGRRLAEIGLKLNK